MRRRRGGVARVRHARRRQQKSHSRGETKNGVEGRILCVVMRRGSCGGERGQLTCKLQNIGVRTLREIINPSLQRSTNSSSCVEAKVNRGVP